MKKLFLLTLCSALTLLTGASFAASGTGSVTVFPASTVPGGTVTVRTVEGASVAQPVKATITVQNPGTCVTGKIPTFVGSLAMNLKPGVLRDGGLSLTTPAGACAGTYTVKVVVTNTSTNTVIASHTAQFTINPQQP